MRQRVAEGGGLARSRRGRHGRRRGRARGLRVLEGAVAGAAVVALALAAGAGMFGRERAQRAAGTVVTVAPSAPVAAAASVGGVGEPTSRAPSSGAAPAAVPDRRKRSEHTDQRAAEYFDKRWGRGDKAAKRLKDIRSVGGYLRIYTDLPESAHNSKQAITLCERGLEYLREIGEDRPVVFVQAEFGENGNPVLANVLGPDDGDCRVTHPAPG
ncbi:hypothetical protein ACWENQ_12600 [Nonomuraea sp. NPDC004354]